MSDYIDKLSATSIPVVPKEHRKQFANYDDAFETGWNEALAYVNDIQPADVEPVRHGHWEVVNDGYGDNAYICECSECKDTVWVYKDADRKWNYCPNCGARMDGEEQEHEYIDQRGEDAENV